ncbi:MAG: hypothetical protein ABI190_06125 [Casimicrobiaceae bacterium]
MTLVHTMQDSDFVLIDGVVCATEYLRVPDEYTVADDVVLEARSGDEEFAFTCRDFDDARPMGDGVYRLQSGHMLRFLCAATLH